jgi:hypothetical protein
LEEAGMDDKPRLRPSLLSHTDDIGP